MRAYDDVIEKNPTNSLAHYGRGVSHRKLGQFDEAVKSFDLAIKHDIYARGGIGWAKGASWSAKGQTVMSMDIAAETKLKVGKHKYMHIHRHTKHPQSAYLYKHSRTRAARN